ncbi:MAG: von Willebrand factor type [Gemmatimonadetes bacterium]|nr:von Willebrand factor type [Gemmatimonadota bacterium]
MAAARLALGKDPVITADTFARPWLLALAAVLPLLAVVGLWLFARRRRRVAERLGDPALVRRLAGQDLARFPWLRAVAVVPAMAALGIAAAGPRWGLETQEASASADAVLVLDASNSMLVADVAPNRLEAERRLSRKLLDGMGDRRVGLVDFAGQGYILSPLTSDRGVLDLYIDNLSTGIVTQSGTSLSSAIRYAAGMLARAHEPGRAGAVVVITDGDALEEQAEVMAAADDARRIGVAVTTVGLGTAAGGPVPDVDPGTGKTTGYKRDLDGSVAHSALRADLLREVARRTGGSYVDAAATPDPAAKILAALAAQPRGEVRPGGGGAGESAADRAWWFVAAALALLAADSLAASRRHPRLMEGSAA